jgi:hypothetical protein
VGLCDATPVKPPLRPDFQPHLLLIALPAEFANLPIAFDVGGCIVPEHPPPDQTLVELHTCLLC